MKNYLAVAAILLFAGSTAAFAQDHRDDHGMQGPAMQGPGTKDRGMQGSGMAGPGGHGHPEWKKGGRIEKNDWNRGQRVDYRSHHLSAPPRGYEWRQVDGNYVLAAAATGLIASILIANQ